MPDECAAARRRPLDPDAVAGVLATAARLHLQPAHDPSGEDVTAELASTAGIDAATLARAHADRLLQLPLAGLTPLDRRIFRAKSFLAALPGSLVPRRPNDLTARMRAQVLARAAKAARKAGSAHKALWLARRAVGVDPSCIDGWYQLGWTLEKASRLEAAADAYRQAIELGLTPGETEALPDDAIALANALHQLAMLVENSIDDLVIETMYRRAMALQPSCGITPYNLGLFYKVRGRFQLAEELFALSARLRPDDPDPGKQLGIVREARQG